jgi:hypothetical protein
MEAIHARLDMTNTPQSKCPLCMSKLCVYHALEKANARIAELEARVAELSVGGVFDRMAVASFEQERSEE